MTAPEGRLRVSKSGKYIQFYWVKKNGPKNGRYLRKTSAVIRALAQKAYDADAAEALESELMLIRQFLQKSRFCGSFTPHIPPELQPFAEPMTITDEEYEASWRAVTYERKGFRDADGWFLGKNLIITMETKERPLDEQYVQQVIDAYLV